MAPVMHDIHCKLCALEAQVDELSGRADLDEQTLTPVVDPITGVTTGMAISNGNTVPIVHPDSPTEAIGITCQALRNLGTAGNVVPGQEYIVTDYDRGTLGAAIIMTHGVTDSTVSWSVAVQTTFDDSAWMGKWDPDTCRIIELTDNRGNEIHSDNGDEIETFPWGVPAVSGNHFDDVDFNYTGGTVTDNVGGPDVVLTVGDSATVDNNTIYSGAQLTVRGTARARRVDLESRGRLVLDGTAIAEEIRVSQDSYVDFDSLQVHNSRFEATSLFYGDGGVGRVDQLTSDRGYTDLRNAAAVNIDDVHLGAYGRILANGAASIRLLRVTAADYGYFQVGAGALMVAQYSRAETLGYIRSLTAGGTLNVNRTHVRQSARINHQSTGSNSANYVDVDSGAGIEFLNSVTGSLADYDTVSSSGLIRFRGTSVNSRVHRSEVNSGRIDIQDSDAVRIYYTTVETISYVHVRAGSDGFYMGYTSLDSYGRMIVEQASGGRVLGTALTSTAYVRLRAHASDLRYSDFSAYFYYYLTGNTAPKQGLHGTGRQSYTEPNPGTTVTGPGVRNW